jgi:hypothetical protein
MKFVVLALSSAGAEESLRKMHLLFGDALDAAMSHLTFETRTRTIFFTPIVTGPGIGPFPDRITCRWRITDHAAAGN